MAIEFPKIDPIALDLGVAQIHWYALSYVAGFLIAWGVARYLTKIYKDEGPPNAADIDDFLSWAIVGVLLGGRLGYVLFYNLPVYLDHPFEALKVWHGGMSFHGGALGVIAALILYAKVKKVDFFRLADVATTVVPIDIKLFDDLSRVAGGAVSILSAVGKQLGEGLKDQMGDKFAMPQAANDDVDRLQGVVSKLRLEQEDLKSRIAALESLLGLSSQKKSAAKPAKKTAAKKPASKKPAKKSAKKPA